MSDLPPPTWARARFWTYGARMPPQHRRWAAAQITDPGFVVRRTRGLLAVQALFVAGPQLVLAATGGGWWHLAIAGFVLLVLAAATRYPRRLTSRQRELLLAHQGVTASGELVEPVSYLRSSGVTPASLSLLTVGILVLGTGLVVVGDHHVSPDRCRAPEPAQVAALQALLGRTQLPGGPPSPPDFVGARLVGAQQVDTVFDGVHLLAAYAQVPGEGRQGPAVWRVFEPGGAFPVRSVSISAADEAGRALTPTSGYSSSSGEDPLLAKARSCARDAV